MKKKGLSFKQGSVEPFRMHDIYDYRFMYYTNQEELDDIILQVKVQEGDILYFVECSVFTKVPNCYISFYNCLITLDSFLLFNSKSVWLSKCTWTNELIESLKKPNCCVTNIISTDDKCSDFGDFYSVKYLSLYDNLIKSLPPFLEHLIMSGTILNTSLKWPKSLKYLTFSHVKLNGKIEIPAHEFLRVVIDFDCDLIRHIKTKELELCLFDSYHIFHNNHVRKLISHNSNFILSVVEQNSGIQDYEIASYQTYLKPRIDAAIHQNRAIFRAAREATLTWMGLRLILRDVARIIGEFVWESRFERDIWI